MRIRGAVLERLGSNDAMAQLQIDELELAAPRGGEILVRVDAAGLCHSDLSVLNGDRPRPTPMLLGHEATGTVVELGAGVSDLQLGQRVVLTFVPACGRCDRCLGGRPALCAAGAAANAAGTLLSGGRLLSRGREFVYHHLGVSAFATHAVVDRGSVVPVPDGVPAQVAALFGCAVLTGAGAVLNTARVQPGESVAVLGLGGIGLAAVMAARVAGASRIVVVDPVASKRELALEVGATEAYSPASTPDELREQSREGVDVCIEAAGRVETLEAAFELGGRGSRIVTVGLPHPAARAAIPVARLVGESKSVLGSYLGDSVPQRDVPRLIALWQAGRFPVERMLSDAIDLQAINEGFQRMVAGASVRTVITMSGESAPA